MRKTRKLSFVIAMCFLVLSLFMPMTASAAVKISSKSLVLNVGKTHTLKVSGTKKAIKWSTSKKSIAKVSSKGVVKAIKKGTCTITAKYGSKKLTCKLTVKQPVTSIVLNKTSATIEKKKTVTLSAEVLPANANNKTITWKSSNTSVATVSSKGVVTGVGEGTATITATANDGSKKTAKCKIKVTANDNPIETRYQEGMYKVGATIPAGEYYLFCTGSISGYYSISNDSSGSISSIISNDNFDYNSIIRVSVGQYLTLKRCYAVPVTQAAINVDKANERGAGFFRVGKDIPAGQYCLLTTSSISGYYSIQNDVSGTINDIITNDNFKYNSIITVQNGQYLEFSRCTIARIDKAKFDLSTANENGGGMFRVGKDIPAGEYMLRQKGDYSGYYQVMSSDLDIIDNIITNDNFKNTAYITLKDGQYIKFSRCSIELLS